MPLRVIPEIFCKYRVHQRHTRSPGRVLVGHLKDTKPGSGKVTGGTRNHGNFIDLTGGKQQAERSAGPAPEPAVCRTHAKSATGTEQRKSFLDKECRPIRSGVVYGIMPLQVALDPLFLSDRPPGGAADHRIEPTGGEDLRKLRRPCKSTDCTSLPGRAEGP